MISAIHITYQYMLLCTHTTFLVSPVKEEHYEWVIPDIFNLDKKINENFY